MTIPATVPAVPVTRSRALSRIVLPDGSYIGRIDYAGIGIRYASYMRDPASDRIVFRGLHADLNTAVVALLTYPRVLRADDVARLRRLLSARILSILSRYALSRIDPSRGP